MPTVDLNSDLGESYGIWRLGDDEQMLEVVTSANIACGYHAGDPSTLRRVCDAAAARGVAIGAQVSYPDLLGFGRRHIAVEPEELRDLVLYQIGGLAAFALAAGTTLSHVKPHGALYHATIADDEQAAAVVAAVREFDSGLAVLGLPGSALLGHAGAAGLNAVAEAFADRSYEPDGRLVARNRPGAVLSDPDTVARRVVDLVTTGMIEAVDGSRIAVEAATICVHGDTPAAVEIARRLRGALDTAGVTVAPFRR